MVIASNSPIRVWDSYPVAIRVCDNTVPYIYAYMGVPYEHGIHACMIVHSYTTCTPWPDINFCIQNEILDTFIVIRIASI